MQDDLQNLIGKLREIEEQVTMALSEASCGSLLESRLRHVVILAKYVRMGIEKLEIPPELLGASGKRPPKGRT